MINATQTAIKPGDEHLVAHLRLDSVIAGPLEVSTWVPDLGDDIADPAAVVLSVEVGTCFTVADARALAAALNLAATAAEELTAA